MTDRFFGAAIERREDARLLTGRGKFVDDIAIGALHAVFVRSQHAHARILEVDLDAALELEGVAGIFIYEDLAGSPMASPLPLLRHHHLIDHARTPFLLARDEVNYLGQPIAMIVAADRYIGEDAADLVRVRYETLPVAVDLARAADDLEGPAHADLATNVYAEFGEEFGTVDPALADAPHRFDFRFRLDRAAGTPLEGRAVLAQYDPGAERIRLWDTTQGPMLLPGLLAPFLELDPECIEAISPDVGGGFGTKNFLIYPEEVLVPWAARRLGRPVKWVEDRREHFTASNQQRSQVVDVKVGTDALGRILALDVRFLHDSGAFCQSGLLLPQITASQLSGNYRIANLRYRYRAVYTNTTQCSPYRGSGQPYATFMIERVMDKVAQALAIDRMEIRRRNFVPPDAFPYHVGTMLPMGGATVYDSGSYAALLDQALEAIGYAGFPAERQAAEATGRRIGLGLACYIEAGGIGPYEGAKVSVLPDGTISVAAGSSDTGQGHETTFAQLVADEFGMPIERIRVVTGDSRRLDYGMGSWASRTAVVAGSAVVTAARGALSRTLTVAARLLQANPDEVEIVEGEVRRKGANQGIPLGQVAAAARFSPVGAGQSPGLTEVCHWSPSMPTFSSGVHAVVIEIDPETCDPRILRYVIADDCGKIINPLLVRGQILGGFAHGIADALYERRHYDESGQLLNASFMDYLIPFATEIPRVTLCHTETPSPANPLGVKGVAEGGTIPVPAAIASAIEDALGVAVDAMPLAPLTLFELMRARSGGAGSRAP